MGRRDDERIAAAKRRRDLTRLDKRISGLTDWQGCGRTIKMGDRGSATEVLTKRVWCRRKWLCAVCGYSAAQRERRRLERRARLWDERGGSSALLSLTLKHDLDDDLASLWGHLDQGWAAMQRGRTWATVKRSYGIAAFICATEVVHNPSTGWHPHLHALLFLDSQPGPSELKGLRLPLAERFAQGVISSGGHAEAKCQDLRPVLSGSAQRTAKYLTKATTEYPSGDGSRSPLAILGTLHDTRQDFALWREFNSTISARPRRRQINYSKNIDAILSAHTLGESNQLGG